jgi:hypothetical protein
MTTLRQIEANRRNSLLSCGPRTPEGKEKSRRNALKHGLAGAGVVLPEDEAAIVAQRRAEWHSSLRPWNPFEEWLIDEITVAAVQIDQCRAQEALLRTEFAERAGTSWDDDRRLAAEVLAAGLAKKPALISRQLQQTRQGCDWILERWDTLGRILESKGDWSEAQKALALDLLGTPTELRDGPTRLDPAPGQSARAHRVALVAGEIQRLKTAQETVLAGRDERDRLAAEIGLDADAPRPLALVRRYLTSCRRRFWQAYHQLRRGTNSRTKLDPTSAPPPTPPSTPATPLPPPFDAGLVEENDEPDEGMFGFDKSVLDQIDPELLAELKLMAELESKIGFHPLDDIDPAPAPAPAPQFAPTPSSTPSRPVAPTPFLGNRRARRAQASRARRA